MTPERRDFTYDVICATQAKYCKGGLQQYGSYDECQAFLRGIAFHPPPERLAANTVECRCGGGWLGAEC
jgi:hypothetical protein